MAIEFNEVQKKKVIELTTKPGWSQGLAEVAVAAEAAGLSNPVDAIAAVFPALANINPDAAEIAAERKRIQTQLKELEGKGDFKSIQKSIGLKNALFKLR